MFSHNKRLQYTVRVSETNPGLANLMLEQFGGADGELAAAMRYFTQGVGEDDPGRKDMLMDIATEELSHLEVIGSIVAMLNKGAKAQLAEGKTLDDILVPAFATVREAAKRALGQRHTTKGIPTMSGANRFGSRFGRGAPEIPPMMRPPAPPGGGEPLQFPTATTTEPQNE